MGWTIPSHVRSVVHAIWGAMSAAPDASTDFRHVLLPRVNKRVLRLGLASNYGLKEAGLHHAAERGVNYWLWGAGTKALTPILKKLLAQDRDKHVVAMLAGVGYTAGIIRRKIEWGLRQLAVDQIDIYQLPWLGRLSRFSERIEDELEQLKHEGKIRASGTSIHDRIRAGQLAENSKLDGFMMRYNAKHTGAEQDIFPHLKTRNPFVVAYTATSWRQLIRPIKGIEMPSWPGAGSAPPLTAGLCYRFCLSNPNVHVTLTGPATKQQLDENLDALEAGPLSTEEETWIRDYGRQVKAKKKLDYI